MVNKLKLFNKIINTQRYLRNVFSLTYFNRGIEGRKSKLFKHKIKSKYKISKVWNNKRMIIKK